MSPASLPPVLYHGTRSAEEILRDGFRVSTAGGGQRGLLGVWFSVAREGTVGYSRNAFIGSGPPTVLSCRLRTDRVVDLTASGEGRADLWLLLGMDWERDETARTWIRENGPFGVTRHLQQNGWRGARIPCTLGPGPDEVVAFHPEDVEILHVEIL